MDRQKLSDMVQVAQVEVLKALAERLAEEDVFMMDMRLDALNGTKLSEAIASAVFLDGTFDISPPNSSGGYTIGIEVELYWEPK